MKDLFRETFAGRAINILSGGRVLVPPSVRAPVKNIPSEGSDHNLDLAAMDVVEKAATGHLVTWTDENDPANPQNWSLGKKIYVSTMIYILTFSIYVGSAIYTSGAIGIEEKFHVSSTVVTLGLSLFVFGEHSHLWLISTSDVRTNGRL
jgi:hypothetical protein